MPGETGAFAAFRRQRRGNHEDKNLTALKKKSLRYTLPEVFVKSIICGSPTSLPEKTKSPLLLSSVATKDEEQLCQQCKKKVDEVETLSEYEIQFNGLSDNTVLISHQLKMLKEQRRKFEEQQKLNEVLERVQAALEYSGIKFYDNEAPVELPTFQNDMFNFESRKQKRKERSYIYEMFEESEKLGRTRDDVMQDVENWFAVSCDDLDSFCNLKTPNADDENMVSDDYFIRVHKAFRRSTESINKLVNAVQRAMYGGAGGKPQPVRRRCGSRSRTSLQVPSSTTTETESSDVVEKVEPGYRSSQESVSEHKIKINKKIFTENELNSWKGMQQALKIINTLVLDGSKQGISNQAKSCYKVGSKQMKILVPIIERKMEVISDLEEKLRTLTSEVTSLKFDQQQRAHDKTQIRQLSDENQRLREEIEGLQQHLREQELQQNKVQYETAQRITSRHVSIKLPEEGADESENEDLLSGSVEEVAEINIVVEEIPEDEPAASVMSMRENLKKKLSSRRSVLQHGSRTPSRNTPSRQSEPSKTSVTIPAPVQTASIIPASAAKLSKAELYDYDSESVSSQEQFESVVKKSEQIQTDQLRQQIHMLREELRQTDDRYYEQRAELESLREIVAAQSASKSDHGIKDKEKAFEKKIDKLQMQQKLLKKELGDKKQDLFTKQHQIEGLQQQIKELLKERECMQPSGQVITDKPIEPPKVQIPVAIDISQMPRDQLVAKISRQSELELNRLRKFIVREQQRFQANLRRNNLDANKQLTKLRNDHNQITRAVAHFKDTVEKLLHDETLGEKASLLDGRASSSMSLLDGTSGAENTSVDALVTLERRLYNMFMQNRLALKHTNASKVTTEKELEQMRFQFQKRTMECTDQQQITKRTEVRNEVLTQQCKQLSYLNQSLQKELEPCKDLMRKYNSIQEEVERIKVTEREQERDTKRFTKELEADRTRLKKEINQLTMAQICSLKKNNPNKLWSRLTCIQKKEVIDKAYSMSQITSIHHDAGNEILDYCNELVLEQFANLVTNYIEHCKYNRIKQSIKSLAARYNNDMRFNRYLNKRMETYEHSKVLQQELAKTIKEDQEKAFLLLKRVLGESFEGFIVPSIQLSKPTYPKPPKSTPQQCTRQPDEPINKFVSTIVGKGLAASKSNKQSYWQMPPDVPENLVQVTVPRILAMDVNCHQGVLVKNMKNQKKPYLPPIATLYP